MAMTTQSEIERKYDVDGTMVLPRFDQVADVADSRVAGDYELAAEYFDTAGEDLAAHRITLRRREGGSDEGWHLKLPAAEGRTELRWPLDLGTDDDGPVPAEVLDPVRAIVRDRPLRLLARIRTRRLVTHLIDAEGRATVEIADDTVSASDAESGVARIWREWEAELLDDAPGTPEARAALLDGVEERLLAAGARPAASASKLASALGRTELGAPSPAPHLDASSAASEVLIVTLRALVADVVALDARVRRDEPDSVHQLRTRVRRLRSVLATYRTVFDRSATDPVRDLLREFGAVLGEARDIEVMAGRARSLAEDHGDIPRSVGEVIAGGWEARAASARAAVVAELSGRRYFRLLDALDDLVARPMLAEQASDPIADVVPAALRKDLRRVTKSAERADAAADESARVELLHETRKAAKRLRYAAEAVSDGDAAVFGSKVRALADDAEAVHDLLGEHRDSVLLQQYLRVLATRDGHPFEYGVLYELERHGAALCLADYAPAIARLSRHGKKLRGQL